MYTYRYEVKKREDNDRPDFFLFIKDAAGKEKYIIGALYELSDVKQFTEDSKNELHYMFLKVNEVECLQNTHGVDFSEIPHYSHTTGYVMFPNIWINTSIPNIIAFERE